MREWGTADRGTHEVLVSPGLWFFQGFGFILVERDREFFRIMGLPDIYRGMTIGRGVAREIGGNDAPTVWFARYW